MKNLLLAASLLFSVQAFSQEMMGNEAIEMFSVMNHRQVKECLKDFNGKLVNLTIQKNVYRCPGCNTYIISGNKRNIDIATTDKVVITLKGRGERGFGGGFVQQYECSIEE